MSVRPLPLFTIAGEAATAANEISLGFASGINPDAHSNHGSLRSKGANVRANRCRPETLTEHGLSLSRTSDTTWQPSQVKTERIKLEGGKRAEPERESEGPVVPGNRRRWPSRSGRKQR